jgi:ferredoxin-type protein NapH
MKGSRRLTLGPLLLPGISLGTFWALGWGLWRVTGLLQPLLVFGYIATALGIGLGLYAFLPRKRRQWGRRITLVLVGGMLLAYVGVIHAENLQIEWVFFSLLVGFGGAAFTHYLVAKVLGPILFGRLWCGWACWTLMVLDLLPFRRSPGRLAGRWERLRYVHFGLSLSVVLLLWGAFGYAEHVHFGSPNGLAWMLAGNAIYYAGGVGMAFWLRDNRAFCKYLCPVPVFQKATSRYSLLKIEGSMERCDECSACVKMCPMDIQILEYLRSGRRVLSTECMLCQTCITVCARDALRVSIGFDLGGREFLRVRPLTVEDRNAA